MTGYVGLGQVLSR